MSKFKLICDVVRGSELQVFSEANMHFAEWKIQKDFS